MQLLWIILRALFPTDPVQQCIGAARHRIALMVKQVFSPESLFLLEHDPRARLYIESLIIDYEAGVHLAIGARACQVAKVRFRMQPRAFYKPTRALSTERLLARIRALVTLCANIERLAQIRAERLRRERDADPLELGATSPLRHVASQRATSPDFVGGGNAPASFLVRLKGGGGGPRALARETERAAVSAQAPPVFDVYLNPKPASQAHPRGRGPLPRAHLNRPPSPPALTLPLQQPTCERTFTLRGLSA
jgi:hypothetical protein